MEVSDGNDDRLWRVCRKLSSDFEPYGERKRESQPDCSTCFWFQPLLRPGQLDWGTCANPHSPRAGLLTFWKQGCEQFEQEKEPGSEDMRRNRSDFKDAVENILCDALGAFTRAEIAKLNPYQGDEFHVFRWEDKLDTILFSQLPRLFRNTTGEFDRRQAANEMVIEAKQNSKRFWEIATRSLARRLKQDASTIRQPDNVQSLEDDFWRRMDAAVTETLEQRG
jgi:hypothetical protein